MDDLISRRDAIRILDSAWVGGTEYQGYLHEAFEKLPSIDAVPQWIPCSKRMPEESEQTYWCCSETGYQFQCRWTNNMYGFGATEYSKWGWHVMDKPQYSTVIAWMPLPEPVRGEENVKVR